VRRRLRRTKTLLGKVIPGESASIGDENEESYMFIRQLRIPLMMRPLRRTYVVVVRKTELLCGGTNGCLDLWRRAFALEGRVSTE